MSSKWIRNCVRSMSRSDKGRRPVPCRRRVSPPLELEALEQRWVPTVLRPGVINYQVGSALHENVFVESGVDLFVRTWDGTQWRSPVNLGNGGLALNYGTPAAINYGSFENDFVVDGSGTNLYYAFTANGTTWTWVNLGNPGLRIASDPTVVNFLVGSVLHENVFVVDAHGNLELKAYNGSTWQNWVNLGRPFSQLNQSADPAVINYGSYENVFATDILGNVNYAWTNNGTTWHWVNLGNPGVGVFSTPATINYQGPYEDVFVRDSNGNLDNVYWNGAAWHWSFLGNAGLPLRGDPAVINYPVGSGLNQTVFVQDISNNMDFAFWNGSWHWQNLGNPSGGVGLGDPSVINIQVGSTLHQNVFMDIGDLRLLYWDGFSWHWGDFHSPAIPSPAPPSSSPAQPQTIQVSQARPTLSVAAAGASVPQLGISEAAKAHDLLFTTLAGKQDFLEPLGLLSAAAIDPLVVR